MIHLGKKIKQVLEAQHLKVSEFSKKIDKSRTVIYHIFERESLDSFLLYKISKALDYNFFSLYIEKTDSESLKSKPHKNSGSNYYKVKYIDLLEKHSLLLESKMEEYINEK